MITKQSVWKNNRWSQALDSALDSENTMGLLFYAPDITDQVSGIITQLRQKFPKTRFVGCSGAGEIAGTELVDQSAVLTLVRFEQAFIEVHSEKNVDKKRSMEVGKSIAKKFPQSVKNQKLAAVFVMSEGLNVNGTDLVKGLRSVFPEKIMVTGGLAGDGTRFEKTTVLLDAELMSNGVVVIGLYGNGLEVGAQALGGWKPFGPERKVTRSEANVLYELDGRPALALYKEYLGEQSASLPASGLNFPLMLGRSDDQNSRNTVRTLLAIDEKAQSLTFAGDIPQGETVRLMRVSDNNLVAAADECAKSCGQQISKNLPTLSLMVSCVGRRLVLGHSTEEEIEAVAQHLPAGSMQSGFYSYGELAPGSTGFCDLHNQTCTLTWIQEKKAA